jgi:glycosyltransferase involved in cell wall biosynthesis
MLESTQQPELSIVIPMWNERPSVSPLLEELLAAAPAPSFEVLIVDDGSTDSTFSAVTDWHRQDPRVRGVRLAHHSGKAVAYTAGFKEAKGQIVATMDGDLQDDPKDLGRMILKLREGFDLVVGWKQTGKSSKATFIVSRAMNGLLRCATGLKLHDMNCPMRVMRSEVAKELDLRADLHRYIPLLAKSNGRSLTEVPVANRERQYGTSKYSGSKYWNSAISYLGLRLYLRFGERPMFLFGSLGLLCFVLGAAVIAYVVVSFLAFQSNIDDDIPTLVMGVLLTLVGTQVLWLGLLGEILVRRLRFVEEKSSSAIAEVLPHAS